MSLISLSPSGESSTPLLTLMREPLLSLMNDSDTIKLLVTDLAISWRLAKREPGIDEEN